MLARLLAGWPAAPEYRVVTCRWWRLEVCWEVLVGRLEGWKVGRLEGWKVRRLKGLKVGRLEGWKVGKLEGWKVGRI